MTLKKITPLLLAVGIGVFGSQSVLGAVYGELTEQSGVAYCGMQGITRTIGVSEQFEIVDLQQDKDVYTINKDGEYLTLAKEGVNVREVIEVIQQDNVIVRQEATPDSTHLRTLTQGDTVSAVYRSTNGNWYQVVLEDGTEGYIFHSFLEKEALQLLPQEESLAPIEVLQWSVASQVVPRGAVAVIEDVYTGKTFSIKRTFGTNHADVEALTTADTAMIKEIWGGFTWERRPVIVHINGRRLAASLAGMPHGGSTLNAVKDNGMYGVLDLHFRGSRRHKEGNIQAVSDPLHQSAITIAAQYQ